MPNRDILYRYLNGLVTGRLAAGQLLKLAAERTLEEIKNDGEDGAEVWWDWSALDELCSWIEDLVLPDYGRKMELLPFQIWILANIRARKRTGTDFPATRFIVIEAARGAAKTTLACMLLAHELATNPYLQQVDIGTIDTTATGRNAALLAREIARQVGEPLAPRYAPGGPCVVNTQTRSELCVLPPADDRWQGRRSRLVFMDEASRVRTKMLETAMTGSAKRPDAQVICFTTPAKNRDSQYYDYRDTVVGELREGVSRARNVALIWAIDDDDPIELRDDLIEKANPGIDVMVEREMIAQNFEQMYLSGTSPDEFVRQHYARFDDHVSTLVDMADWENCKGEVLLPSGAAVYVGVDLSRGAQSDSNRTDVCSVSVLHCAADGVIHLRSKHFLPEHRLEFYGRRGKLPLCEWARDNFLTLCPGKIIDPDMIEDEVRSAVDEFNVIEVAYDTWVFPRDRKQVWEHKYKWPLASRAQGQFVVPATEGFCDLVRNGRLRHNGDPLLYRALQNVRVGNVQGARRPLKNPSYSMIDPLMSALYGLSSLFEHAADLPSQYEGESITI